MKYVYAFQEGGREQKFLLGGKGANLAEMTKLGLPVPPGFTITTEACNAYMAAGDTLPDGLMDEVAAALRTLEADMGKRLGDDVDPLLVSVRSGAPFSMPGMMDTVLNLGLNDDSVQGLAKQTGNERFAFDSYRRFVQMFGKIVLDVPGDAFEEALHELMEARGVAVDTDLSAEDLRGLVVTFKAIVSRIADVDFPDDPHEQLGYAIEAVFKSWNGRRARDYRRMERIPDDLGTAVNVQAMVYGNKGEDSGTGVAFTRNPSSGEHAPYGDFLANAQGEDVVAGIRITEPLDAMANHFAECHRQLLDAMAGLEAHYHDMCDIEFTIEQGRLFLLQTRVGKRTAMAALRMAVEMEGEGLIDKREAILRIQPAQLDQLLHPQFDPAAKYDVLATGLNASPGAAVGKVSFTADDAEASAAAGASRDPRAPRDLARGPARHDRRGGHPDVARRAREPRRGGGARDGQAGDLWCGRAADRSGEEGVHRRARARDRRRGQPAADHRARGRRDLDQRRDGRGRRRRGAGRDPRARPVRSASCSAGPTRSAP